MSMSSNNPHSSGSIMSSSSGNIFLLKKILIVSNNESFIKTVKSGLNDMKAITANNDNGTASVDNCIFADDINSGEVKDTEYPQYSKAEVQLLQNIPLKVAENLQIDIEQDALAIRKEKIEDRYDIILLDKYNSFGTKIRYITQYWNALNIKVAKIPLIAYGQPQLETEALAYGVNEFINNFSTPVFMLRILKLLKNQNKQNSRIRIGDFEICYNKRQVYILIPQPESTNLEARCLNLTEAEFKVAVLFLQNINSIVNKQQILAALEIVPKNASDLKLADVYVCKFRLKINAHALDLVLSRNKVSLEEATGESGLSNPNNKENNLSVAWKVSYIETVWGEGFKILERPRVITKVIETKDKESSDIKLSMRSVGRPSKKTVAARAAVILDNKDEYSTSDSEALINQ